MLRIVVVFAAVLGSSSAAQWAFLAAGSNGYNNYRHQAEVAHVYQLLVARGVPRTNIITMLYDDVAHDPANPFPGKLFNKPTSKGVAGRDVYANFVVDYRGKDVNAANWLNVLTGKASAVVVVGSGQVLNSTAEDHVFVYFADHGEPGKIFFPSDSLSAGALMSALESMHSRHTYKELVFFLETCYSASMFEALDPDIGIYAIAAANATNEAWSWYCGNSTIPSTNTGSGSVDGVELGACIGDNFSSAWIEDTEAHPTNRTFGEQFAKIKPRLDTYAPPPKEILGHRVVFQPQHMQAFGAVAAFSNKQLSTFFG